MIVHELPDRNIYVSSGLGYTGWLEARRKMDEQKAARLIKNFGKAANLLSVHLQANTLSDAQWEKLKQMQEERRQPEPGESF